MKSSETVVLRLMDIQVDCLGQEISDPRDFDHWEQREVEFNIETGERV